MGTDFKMPDSRRQVLAEQSDATEGAAARSAVSASLSASLATLSAAPRRITSSGTATGDPAKRPTPSLRCDTLKLLSRRQSPGHVPVGSNACTCLRRCCCEDLRNCHCSRAGQVETSDKLLLDLGMLRREQTALHKGELLTLFHNWP